MKCPLLNYSVSELKHHVSIFETFGSQNGTSYLIFETSGPTNGTFCPTAPTKWGIMPHSAKFMSDFFDMMGHFVT